MKQPSLVLTALALAACAPTVLPSRNDGATTDSAAADSARADSGAPADSGVRMDSGAVTDTGVNTDSGVRMDTGVSSDSGVRMDSGAVTDTGVPADSGVRTDAGVVTDTGVVTDAGVVTDSGTGGADASMPPGDGGSGAGGYTFVRNATGATCDALTTPAIIELTGDDNAMATPLALPFALSYYGMNATHWSASTNGIAQLWPSAAGRPSALYANDPIPDVAAPEGLVAPFWDDLSVETTGLVRNATLGAAPSRRFVIEWNAVNTIGLESELTFQVKFFEGSNVIEFHYCTMTDLDSSDRHTGAQATIGTQNFTGSEGTQVSFDTTGTVASGVWIRFTPR